MIRPTLDTVIAAYNLLKTTKPFISWKLPDADELEWALVKDPNIDAMLSKENEVIRISINENINSNLDTLLQSLAHELIHYKQVHLGYKWNHGKFFNQQADKICKLHEWGRGKFS